MTLQDRRIVIKASHIRALMNHTPHTESFEPKTMKMVCGCGSVRDLTEYEKFKYGYLTRNNIQQIPINKIPERRRK